MSSSPSSRLPSHRPRSYVPPGQSHIVPYLVVHRVPQLIGFLKVAFGATEEARTDTRDGTVTHARLRIKDSVIMLCEAPAGAPAMAAAMYLYVRDCEKAFDRAIAAGATPLTPPGTVQGSADRMASVQDPSGNLWFLTTFRPEQTNGTHHPRVPKVQVKTFSAPRTPVFSADRTPR